jgi:hypothetical protein
MKPIVAVCKNCGSIIENDVDLPDYWQHKLSDSIFCYPDNLVPKVFFGEPQGNITYEQIIERMSR